MPGKTSALPGPLCLRIPDQYLPLGIDTPIPRFAWTWPAALRGFRQTAYRILVASNLDNLRWDLGDIWDSGPVPSDRQNGIPFGVPGGGDDGRVVLAYDGQGPDALMMQADSPSGRANGRLVQADGKPLAAVPLQSHRTYFAKVQGWDSSGQATLWSPALEFSTALLAGELPAGKWIRHAADGNRSAQFRKEFTLPADKTVAKAEVLVCGLGQSVLSLNGAKVGADVLEPGWTDYSASVLYVTHDVTSQVLAGRNALGLVLGGGFYDPVPGGRHFYLSGGTAPVTGYSYGPLKALLELRVTFTDGTGQSVLSDATWKTIAGPTTLANIYGSEDYDARLETPGWDRAGFNDAAWAAAAETAAPPGPLESQKHPPLRIHRVLESVKVTEPKAGTWVFDLGTNISGQFGLTVKGAAGAKVTLRPGEKLKADGTVDPTTDSYLVYTLKGGGEETWMPRFSWYGSRWIQVEGATRDAARTDLPAILAARGDYMYSAADSVGAFRAGDARYEAIHGLILGAIRSNLQHVLTDCPTVEKLGWLEVSHLMGPSIMYEHDVRTLWTKIAKDAREAQLPNGMVPDIAPEYTIFAGAFRDTPTWGSALIMDPWLVYQFYGDSAVLAQNYAAMTAYAGYLATKAAGNVLTAGLGDWGSVDNTSPPNVETATYYQDLVVLAQSAELLGKAADSKKYRDLAQAVLIAYNAKFFDAAKSAYLPLNQTNQAMPLLLGMVPPGQEAKVFDNLLQNIKAKNDHFTCGEVGMRFLLQALAARGRNDLIHTLIMQPDHPSYARFLARGETTLPEYFQDNARSRNHAMYGQIVEWFYNTVGGISPAKPGFAEIRIRPAFPRALTWASASYASVRGAISSDWKLDSLGKRFDLNVTVPGNTQAVIHVPTLRYPQLVVTESGRRIWEGDAASAPVAGIAFVSRDSDYVAWRVGAGNYRFTAWGNPSQVTVSGKLPLAVGPAEYRVFDLAGRELGFFRVRSFAAWDRRLADGLRLPAGTYLFRAAGRSGTARGRSFRATLEP